MTRLVLRPGADAARVRREPGALVLEVPIVRLAGPAEEVLTLAAGTVTEGPLTLLETADETWGMAVGEPGEPPQAAARRLYTAVLAAAGDRALCRVWNYVPAINEEQAGLENYRAFNAGRMEALRAAFGPDVRPRLPAASALGVPGDRMALVFCATRRPVQHFENPEQMPACDYPSEWGPVPPAFARGTRVEGSGGRLWYLSGTASIRGHVTRGGGFASQFALTLENVRLMLQRMAVPPGTRGQWKIFLRHADDLATCQDSFRQAFPGEDAHTLCVRTEICRPCLLVEIEATFPAQPGPPPP